MLDVKLSEQSYFTAAASGATLVGIDAHHVDVETHIKPNPTTRRLTIIGLPDGIIREAKERIRCAIENSGWTLPYGDITVSLGPAVLPKQGSGLDLPIALSILAASGAISKHSLSSVLALGELSLDGRIKGTYGALAAAHLAHQMQFDSVIVPAENATDAALIEQVAVYPATTLGQIVGHLVGSDPIIPQRPGSSRGEMTKGCTFADVIGQHTAKRVLEIAAAGGHNVLFVGPPGSGKSMLAERFKSLLPRLNPQEILEVRRIYSAYPYYQQSFAGVGRPFRSPHHSTSLAGLVGGGPMPVPGEISLAHRGVLFLDELTEFRREALEALRQPLETKRVTISRARMRMEFPADFLLIAAMNPCPCGRSGIGDGSCRCSKQQIARYVGKISGPLLDRIDLQIWVGPLMAAELGQPQVQDPTPTMKQRIKSARASQEVRNRSLLNSQLQGRALRRLCKPDSDGEKLLERAVEKYHLSARSYMRILKVARTIADLEKSDSILTAHISEALSYRLKL